MSDVDASNHGQPAAGKPRRAKAATRVDTAHQVASQAESPSVEMPRMTVEPPAAQTVSAETTFRQVRAQAAQLATHLQRQQAAVDHREAELNARLAAMENEIRAARLWLNERHDELAQRTSELDNRARELDQREAALTAITEGRKPRKAKPLTVVTDERRIAELDRRQAELDALSERLSDRFSTIEHARDFEHAMQALEARGQKLRQAEKLLADELSQLADHRHLLSVERKELAAAAAAERERLAEDLRRSEAEQAQARAELEKQAADVAAQQRALQAMREEILRGQQDAIELRLVTEETWARMCDRQDAAALGQSIAQLRLRLAAEHRRQRTELAQEKAEFTVLSDRLAEVHRNWSQQRDDFQAWVLQKQQDFERQAAVLVEAGRQLSLDREAMCEERLSWQFERSRLQAEIRGLLNSTPRRTNLAA